MLVVGSRGAGGVRGLALGSVSQYLIHHAPSTTVIAHHRGAH
ncbi:universal stress protein [Spirillospora sp. NPDC048832]